MTVLARSVGIPAVVAVSVTALVAGLTTGAAAATTPADPPGVVVEGGLTQPVYPFAEAVEERLWVETPLDTDADGRLDRVVVDVSRPGATETAGLQVPVILEVSPYRSGTWNDVPYKTDLDPDVLPQSRLAGGPAALRSAAAGPGAAALHAAEANLPGSLDDYYVPRGYGVVIAQSVGTADSDGCPTTGDDAETQSAKAIVDWLNGRARAFDAPGPEGTPVDADWTTGTVGMTGGSYNGTIPNQLATTGVEGLATIVPVVAISDWYGYYRENGLVVAPGGYQGEDADVLARFVAGEERATGPCVEEMAAIEAAQDRVTGDYSDFWDARNYLDGTDDVQASVFVVSGRNDWNVKPLQWGRWWDGLTEADVPRKVWLTDGGHSSPGNSAAYTLPDGTSWTYQTTVHRWFDHWLWGVDNGIMDEPRAIVQDQGRGTNRTFADWPLPGSADTTLRLRPGTGAPGALVPAGQAGAGGVEQSFVDAGRERLASELISDPDAADPNRLAYLSEPLASDVHLSGTPSVSLGVAVENADAANLTAYLVDYGPPASDGSTEASMVTRGWIDVQNRNGRERTDGIRPGTSYRYTWDLHPDDYVFAAGHRIGLVVLSTDYDFTLRPLPGTQLTVDTRTSSLTLPVLGGSAAF